MKKYEFTQNTATIIYTIEENYDKKNPLYLENLTYDLPFNLEEVDSLEIKVVIPKKMSAHIIDDLHFSSTNSSTIELILHESSQATYQLFVANHQLCQMCCYSTL